ncbi:hypothetical protein KVR01_004104 [Diaporthe batatas]|uniref:uncharacterized protein n=1 Tax=Diaporthe batatas TaxID=748121 RepID=UPI001D038B74|nr:uncharacterized protein KVR01_004104 [Diaporthe batatas]KAG8165552.1 hypothetical protein KVR01_004104 [Diaporthe batatas]
MADADLISLLRRYEVPVDQSSLDAVFRDEEQGRLLSEWAKSHLVTDTLLTQNELNSYLALQRSGKAESLAASADLSRVQPSNDQELLDAIGELNRSTDAINKQTETLRQQQNAVSRLIAASGKNGDARSDLEAKRLYEWESTRKALQTNVELLSQGIDCRISELCQGIEDSAKDLANVVDDVFNSDDKLLSSLQKLGLELDMEDRGEAETVSQLREICARLIKYNVECTRTQLDRSYLESLQSSSASGSGSGSETRASKEEISALQEELESLYSEILPVAQMSVEQQWLEPSLRSLSTNTSQGLSHAAVSIHYILDCLDHLQDRIDRVSERVALFKAHESATCAMISTAKVELSTTVASNTAKDHANVPHLSSPARRFQPADDMMTPAPRRARTNTQSRRRSSGGASNQSPLEHLLGELGISLPAEDDHPSATASLLSRTLAERRQNAADVADSVQSTFEHAATAHLSDARCAIQLIRDSVLAENPNGLVDPGIESSIVILAQEVHRIASRLDGVETEAAVLARGRNVKRDEIVSRWARRS